MTTTTLQVGDPIMTVQQIEQLPIGAVMREANGSRSYIRCRNGTWGLYSPESEHLIPDAGPWMSTNFSTSGYNVLDSLPSGKQPERQVESVAQYRWRYRTNALRGSVEHGVGLARARGALEEMGLGLNSAQHPIGPEVPICREDTVPEGTTAYVGDPAEPRRLGVFGYVGRRWIHLFGDVINPDIVMKVSHWPGGSDEPPEWLTKPGTEVDADRIKVFKARAYRIGDRVRREASWCGTYDSVMARVGVSANSVAEAAGLGSGLAPGDTVNQAAARSAPIGTVFGWVDPFDVGRFAVFIRDESMDHINTSGTVRVCGQAKQGTALGNFRSGMTVLHIPGDTTTSETDWNFRLGMLHQWVTHLPVGCFFRVGTSASVCHIARDGRINSNSDVNDRSIRDTGRWSPGDFGNDTIYLIGYSS